MKSSFFYYALSAFCATLIFLSTGAVAAAQATSEPDDVIVSEEPQKPLAMLGNAQCTEHYHLGSVRVELAPLAPRANPGETIAFTGIATNNNTYPLVGVDIYVKVFRRQPAGRDALWNGHHLVDQFVAVKGATIGAKVGLPLSLSWKVPVRGEPGEYIFATYVVVGGRYNLSGLTYSDRIFALETDFTVGGGKYGSTHFDKNSVLMNGRSYAFAASLPTFTADQFVVIEATVVNNTNELSGATVAWRQYDWDGQREEMLVDTKTQTFTLAAGESRKISYVATKHVGAVTYIVADLLTVHETRSILDMRFMRSGIASARINFPSLVGFPLESGVANTIFSCFHAVGSEKEIENGKLVLNLSDTRGRTIAEHVYEGKISQEMMAEKKEFIPKKNYDKAVLTATLSAGGKVIEEYSMTYDCNTIDPTTCSNEESRSMIWLVVLLALILALVLYYYNKKRGMTNNTPKTPLGGGAAMLVLLLAMTLGMTIDPNSAAAAAPSVPTIIGPTPNTALRGEATPFDFRSTITGGGILYYEVVWNPDPLNYIDAISPTVSSGTTWTGTYGAGFYWATGPVTFRARAVNAMTGEASAWRSHTIDITSTTITFALEADGTSACYIDVNRNTCTVLVSWDIRGAEDPEVWLVEGAWFNQYSSLCPDSSWSVINPASNPAFCEDVGVDVPLVFYHGNTHIKTMEREIGWILWWENVKAECRPGESVWSEAADLCLATAPTPDIGLSGDANVVSGGSPNLWWTTQDVTACTITTTTGAPWSHTFTAAEIAAVNGSRPAGPIVVDTTYRLRCMNGTVGPVDSYWTVAISGTPPAPPVVTRVTPYTENGFDSGSAFYGEYNGYYLSPTDSADTYILWEATGNPTSCRIFRNGSLVATQGSATNDLTRGIYYIPSDDPITARTEYKVDCTRGADTSPLSSPAVFTVPDKPSRLRTACDATYENVRLSWRPVVGQNFTDLRFYPTPPGPPFPSESAAIVPPGISEPVANTGQNTRRDVDVDIGTEYFWYLRGVDPLYGNWSDNAWGEVFKCEPPPPTVSFTGPVNVVVNTSPTLSWTVLDATACTITKTAGPGLPWSHILTGPEIAAVNGSRTADPIAGATTYTMWCENGAGGPSYTAPPVTVGVVSPGSITMVSIVCENESYLPDIANANAVLINAAYVDTFLNDASRLGRCWRAGDWYYQYAFGDPTDINPQPFPGGYLGEAGGLPGQWPTAAAADPVPDREWKTFGPTDALNGRVIVSGIQFIYGKRIWVREVLKPSPYGVFSNDKNAGTLSSYSAELRCNGDSRYYDNMESYDQVGAGSKYCIAFNFLNPAPTIISFTGPPVFSGGTPILSWEVTNATDCTINQSVGVVSNTFGSTPAAAPINAPTTYTLTCTNGVGGPSASRDVVVTILPSATLAISGLWDFGDVYLGDAPVHNITVTNSGDAGSFLTGTLQTPLSPATFVCITAPCSFTNLAAGDSRTLQIRYTPVAISAVNETAALNFTSNGGDRAESTWGRGISPIVISGNLNFGQVPLGSNRSMSLTITNMSSAAINTSLVLSAPFSCVSGCAGIVLAPNVPHTIVVNFRPTAVTTYNQNTTLTGRSDAPINISGQGIKSTMEIKEI